MNSKIGQAGIFNRDFYANWIMYSIAGLFVGVILGILIPQPLICYKSVTTSLLGATLTGAIIGGCTGFCQRNLLKGLLPSRRMWILANAIGWAIAVLLLEIYMPIARCYRSSNAGLVILMPVTHFFDSIISTIARQVDISIFGEVVYSKTYDIVYSIMDCLFIGLILGIPQGIAQYLALHKYLPRTANFIWVNLLAWIIIDNMLTINIIFNDKFKILWLLLALATQPVLVAFLFSRISKDLKKAVIPTAEKSLSN